jgi:hypothetical protein
LFEEDEPKEPTLADTVRICLGADDHLRAALEIASGIGVGALEQVIRREHLGLLWQGPTPACTVNAVVGDGTVACGH